MCATRRGLILMVRDVWDAIVVGSGITGGWAAKELSEKGLRVLVLEAGRPIDPARDYLMNAPAFEFDYRYLGDQQRLTARQSVQRKCYACSTRHQRAGARSAPSRWCTRSS